MRGKNTCVFINPDTNFIMCMAFPPLDCLPTDCVKVLTMLLKLRANSQKSYHFGRDQGARLLETLAPEQYTPEQLVVLKYPDFWLKRATSQKFNPKVRILTHYELLRSVSAPAQVSLIKSAPSRP